VLCGAADSNRKKFTGYERDAETGLDFAQARYFSSTEGRFTSADSLLGSLANPQSLNRYAYVVNNPLNSTDPTGHLPVAVTGPAPGAWGDSDSPATPGDLPARYEEEIAGIKAVIAADEAARSAANESDPHGDEAGHSGGEATGGGEDVPAEPQIVFDSVELLDDPVAGFPEGPLNVPRPIHPIRSATADEFNPNQFTLDVDHPKVDPGGILAIRVKFHIIDGDLDTATVDTATREERRWRVAGQPLKVEGGLIFTANVYDKEAKINPIYVTVRATWTASIWERGKLNDVRYKTARAEIRLLIGPHDR